MQKYQMYMDGKYVDAAPAEACAATAVRFMVLFRSVKP